MNRRADRRISPTRRLRYVASYACSRGGGCAGLAYRCDRIGNRYFGRERTRIRREQIDASGTKLDHNQLHDELQFSGCDLPSLVRGPSLLVVERNVIRHHQRHSQRVLSQQLFKSAACLSVDLRAYLAIAVSAFTPRRGRSAQRRDHFSD